MRVRLIDVRNSPKARGCDVRVLVKSKRPLSVRNKSSRRSGPAAVTKSGIVDPVTRRQRGVTATPWCLRRVSKTVVH